MMYLLSDCVQPAFQFIKASAIYSLFFILNILPNECKMHTFYVVSTILKRKMCALLSIYMADGFPENSL